MKVVGPGFLILVMICLLSTGCGRGPNGKSAMLKDIKQRPDADVTKSHEYNFASFADTVWTTKVKVGLVEVKRYNNELAMDVFPPDGFDPTHPKYRPPPGMQRVIAVLPEGTRLRIKALMKDNGNWGGLRVAAVLKDEGPYSQKTVYLDETLLAKNRFIWEGWSDSKEWGVNPDMLEKAVEKNEQK